jgi:hypothetical protein
MAPVVLGAATRTIASSSRFEADPSLDPAALDALADAGGQPLLHAAAAEGWLARADVTRAWQSAQAAGDPDLLDAVAARTTWEAVTRSDSGAGLVAVPRGPGDRARSDSPRARAHLAMLASPWPEAETLVLRGLDTDVLRVARGAVRLQVFCRDEERIRQPCRVPLVVDGEPRTLEIPDASVREMTLPGGRHVVEVAGPGTGRALVVRAERDGRLLPPGAERLALRVTPSQPIVATVAGSAPVAVEVVRGAVRVAAGGREVAVEGPGRAVLSLPAPGPAAVQITGEGDVLLARGTLRDVPPPPRLPPPAAPGPDLPPDTLASLIEAAVPTPVDRMLPSHGGTTWARIAGMSEPLADGTPWELGELEGGWMRTVGSRWAGADAWVRGPAVAGGVGASAARAFAAGWLRGTVDGALGTSDGGTVGRVRAIASGRYEHRFTPDVGLRLDGRLVGAVASPPPDAPVDPRAWDRWTLEHPVSLRLSAAFVADPFRDLRVDVGGRADSNTGPSLDAARGWGHADLLVGHAGVVGCDLSITRRFADLYRLRATWTPRAELSAEVGTWRRGGRWWGAGAVGWAQSTDGIAGFGARLDLTVLATGGRGFFDLAPGATAFRGARDLP